MRFLYIFCRDEQATTSVEYAVMLAMILMAVIGAVGSVGAQTGGLWSNIVSGLRAVGFYGT
jgi:pilus assembly protein Flp/PilA